MTRPGRLIFQTGSSSVQVGRSEIARWTWNHVVLTQSDSEVRIYLNGQAEPEIVTTIEQSASNVLPWFFGGRSDNDSNWEGRLDEIAVFDRVLTKPEIADLSR